MKISGSQILILSIHMEYRHTLILPKPPLPPLTVEKEEKNERSKGRKENSELKQHNATPPFPPPPSSPGMFPCMSPIPREADRGTDGTDVG